MPVEGNTRKNCEMLRRLGAFVAIYSPNSREEGNLHQPEFTDIKVTELQY